MKEDFLKKLKREADLRIPKDAPHLWNSIAPKLQEKSEPKLITIFYYWKSIAATLVGIGILVFLLNQYSVLDKKAALAVIKQEKSEDKLEEKPKVEAQPTPAIHNDVAKTEQNNISTEPKSSVVNNEQKHENKPKEKTDISRKKITSLQGAASQGNLSSKDFDMTQADQEAAPPSPVQNAKPMAMDRVSATPANKMNLVGNYIGALNRNPYWAYIRGDEHAWTMKGNFGNNSASLHEIDADDQQLKFKEGDLMETFQYFSSDENDRYYKNGTDTIIIQLKPNRLKIVLTRKDTSENKQVQTWDLMKANE